MNKEETHKRFLQVVDYLKDNGIAKNQEEIAKMMSMHRPHVAAAINGDMRRFTEGFLRRFAAAYSDFINEDWLLTGDGRMAKPSRTERPHIDARASAGFTDGISYPDAGDNIQAIEDFIPDYDFTISVSGDSMKPVLIDGDLLCCRVVSDRHRIPYGKICVADTREGPIVKLLQRNPDSPYVLFHSINPKYPDILLLPQDIFGIAKVVSVIRDL